MVPIIPESRSITENMKKSSNSSLKEYQVCPVHWPSGIAVSTTLLIYGPCLSRSTRVLQVNGIVSLSHIAHNRLQTQLSTRITTLPLVYFFISYRFT